MANVAQAAAKTVSAYAEQCVALTAAAAAAPEPRARWAGCHALGLIAALLPELTIGQQCGAAVGVLLRCLSDASRRVRATVYLALGCRGARDPALEALACQPHGL